MSIDDLYNNFKIVEQEVKGSTSKNSSSQNMAFVSLPSPNSTNKVSTTYGVSTASTQSSIASTQVSTANLSDATVYRPKSYETESKNASKEITNELKESPDAPLVIDKVSDNKDCFFKSRVMVEKKTIVPTGAKIEIIKAKQ
nr:hypothetical protein [Tanacetum cinerariifolium]